MKKLLFIIIAFFAMKNSNAQLGITGTYDTSFGKIKLVHNSFNSKTFIYGDYRNLGTIISTEDSFFGTTYIFKGKFKNGKDEGSFEWFFVRDQYGYYSSFSGKWGWGNKLDGGEWNGKRVNNTFLPTDLKFAKWSGKWKTNFGEIVLKQNGNQVTGDYGTKGPIEGTITGNILKGTFKNGNSTGYFEFKLDCNKFSGKWGWDKSLNKGKWDGTKVLKTNDCSSNTNSTTNSKPKDIRYRLTLDKIYASIVDDGPNDNTYELFGIAWCRAYDSEGKQIKPFDVTYSDKYGRFWEIPAKDYVRLGQKVYNEVYEINKQITFDFPINNPDNIEEILKKSKIELTVELKDVDNLSSYDVLGKERITVPLNEANIKRIPIANITKNLKIARSKGIFSIKHGSSGIIYIFYYIEKI